MKFTQHELYIANNLLNRCAVNIRGEDVSLYVHYWAGETGLHDNKKHKHSFFELCYIAQGNGTYLEGDVEYRLSSGDLFISRPHIMHQIKDTSDLYIVFVAFEPVHSLCSDEGNSLFQALIAADPFIRHEQEHAPTVMIWEALLRQAQSQLPLLQNTLTSLSYSLLLSSAHLFSPDLGEDSQEQLRFSTTLVHRAKLYIRDNLSQSLRLQEVADYLHISSRHLSRLFADELGRSFSDYVRDERIRQAAFLLSSTVVPIKTISEETGFSTVHYFTSVFKDVLGVTPGEFQKKVNKQS